MYFLTFHRRRSLSAYSAATGEEIDAVTLRRGAPITEEE